MAGDKDTNNTKGYLHLMIRGRGMKYQDFLLARKSIKCCGSIGVSQRSPRKE